MDGRITTSRVRKLFVKSLVSRGISCLVENDKVGLLVTRPKELILRATVPTLFP